MRSNAVPRDFELRAKASPHAIAVEFEGARLTYGELDERSAVLAGALRAQGVGPEVLCALCVERSLEMVVGLLGILRAGGAYVPLDPSYPRDRLAFMADDCGAKILLTQAKVIERLPPTRARLTCLDRDWSAISTATPSATPPLGDEGLVYMIYTSGSTGRPKGALNHHAGVRNRLAWMQETYQLRPDDRVLQKTPFSFDVSVWEFFWPLLVGARIVLAKPDGHRNPDYLSRLIEQAGITVLHFVPSMLQVFLESPELESRCRSVTQVMCSGEALGFETTKRFFARLPHARLHNLYGPTEAAVDVTAYECRADDPGPSVPIGKAIANTQMLILDRELRPVAEGEVGELYIGGVQLGRGYHLRPDLTADRFVPHPMNVGARLYRTGDLARTRADGNIEYLGRIDDQIKIRGFRVELGEIEHVLSAQPGVSASVVILRTDATGTDQLVGYVVPSTEGAFPDVCQLRVALEAALPEQMVPTSLIVLESLPVTPNGKLDRKALPVPRVDRSRHALVEPRDHVELELRRIWETLFDVGSVGVTDDFFDLGGTSLQTMRLVGEIEHSFQRRFPPDEILRSRSIESLARMLRSNDALPKANCLVLLQRGHSRPLFLVHPIGGNVICYVELARKLGPEQTVYGLQASGLDGKDPPLTDNAEIVCRYLALIREVQPQGPYHLGGYSSGGMLAYLLAQRLAAAGEQTDLLFNLDGRAPVGDMRAAMVHKTSEFSDAVMAFWMLVVLGRSVGIEVSAALSEFESREPDARVDHLLHWLQRYDLMPPGVARRQMRAALDVYTANMRALAHTKLEPYAGRMVLVKAVEQLPDRPNAPNPPAWAWEGLVHQIEEHALPGNHFTLLWKQSLERVAGVMRPYLERARLSSS